MNNECIATDQRPIAHTAIETTGGVKGLRTTLAYALLISLFALLWFDAPLANAQTPVLDQISTTAVAAYSLRKVRAGYTGAAIRVRRTDNQEADIGFTASGDLDTTALTNHVGSGASDNGFVTTWYDQSGNGRNATQTMAASQPRLVVNGVFQTEGGKPAILFDGVDDSLTVAAWGTITQPFSRHYVGVRKSFVGASHWINSVEGSATSAAIYDPAAGQHALYAGGFWGALTVSLGNNERAVFLAAYNGASSFLSKTGVLTTGNPGDQGFSGIRIGCRSSTPGDGCSNITMQELIVVASGSVISTTDRQTLERDQVAFYGILSVYPASLRNVMSNSPYPATTFNASGGNAPYTFAVTSGTLPTGLSLNSTTGALTGTPTATDTVTYTFTITVTDANLFNGSRSYTVVINPTVPDPPTTPVLDQVSASSAAAYSLRKVRAGYTGAAIRVRRTDNQEADIGFTASGDLDTTALTNHVGSGASDNGFVTTWYDQSGNGRNATQTTAASQPRLVVNGVFQTEGGKPAILFDGVDDSLTVAAWGTIAQPFSRHYVGVRKSFAGISHWINSVDGAPNTGEYDHSEFLHNMYAGGAVTASLNNNERTVFSAAYNGASSLLSKNGDLTTGNPGSNGFSGIRIGCFASNFACSNITMQELIVITSAVSTADRQTLERNQGDFYGFGVIPGSIAPSIPTAVTATAGNAQATVTFTAPASDGGSAITSYTATSSPGNITGTCLNTPAPCTSITVSGLTNSTAYTFTVTATNGVGTSAASVASNSVTPKATQATLVAVSTPSTVAFGGTTTLSTTGGSGTGAVTYASNNANCTISGTTLTAAAVGTCTVTATKAADTNYAAATSAGITVTVSQTTQATLVAVSTPSTVTFGGTTTLSTTGGSGTGAVTYASNNANCTIVGTTLTAAGAGTCTITATKAADTNYTLATSAGITVTVNQATQATLVAVSTPSTVTFGGTTTLSTTGGSGTGAVTYASNNANCTISGTTLTAAAVGTCTITATKAADTNYAAATSAGITVTVSQAPQATLVAVSTPATVAFGGTTTLSTTGGSGTGAVTYASNNANCTISGTTLTAAAVGTCTVTATKAADSNYTVATATVNISVAATVPGAPTIGTATAGNAQASVIFTAPASNGGSAITSYTATSSPGNITGTCSNTPTPCTSITVSSLTNGTAYTFTVRATNSVGTGPASAASNSVTPVNPIQPPSAPSAGNCVMKLGVISCNFAGGGAGSGSGGTTTAPITGYQMMCRDSDDKFVATQETTSDVLQLAPLPLKKIYACQLFANSAVGPSVPTTVRFALNVVPLAVSGQFDFDGRGFASVLLRGTLPMATIPTTQIGRWDGQTIAFSQVDDIGRDWTLLGAADTSGAGRSALISRNLAAKVRVDQILTKTQTPNQTPPSTSGTIVRNAKLDWVVDAVGDLDGDGKADILWRYTKPGTNDSGVTFAWFMGGGESMVDGVQTKVDPNVNEVKHRGGAPLNWSIAGIIDLNADSLGDIVWISPTNQVRALMGQAGRTWVNTLVGQMPAGYTILKLGDMDGDGKGDIVMRDTNGNIKVWLMNGTQIKATYDMIATAKTWQLYAAGDFDGNGAMDFVWMKPDRKLVVWLTNPTNITFPYVYLDAGAAPDGLVPVEP